MSHRRAWRWSRPKSCPIGVAQAVDDEYDGCIAGILTLQSALEAWVEKGVVPEQIIATHVTNGVVDRLRPLCPYPKVATYKGKGDTNDAGNFVCRDP